MPQSTLRTLSGILSMSVNKLRNNCYSQMVKLMRYFILINVLSNWSHFYIFPYTTVKMTTNIGASVFINKFFYLERTSLFVLIVFGFRKATLGGDGRPLWSLNDLKTCLRDLRRRGKCSLSSTFLSHIKRNSSLYQSDSFNFWINMILSVSTFY